MALMYLEFLYVALMYLEFLYVALMYLEFLYVALMYGTSYSPFCLLNIILCNPAC